MISAGCASSRLDCRSMRNERYATKNPAAASAATIAFQTVLFTCATLIVIAMFRAETITSAANPLLKDVRRAIVRGSLTQQGWWVAETFHLLAEALRSDCEVKMVLAAESARAATEQHLQRLN